MLTIREQNLRGVKALTSEWRQGGPSPTSELWPPLWPQCSVCLSGLWAQAEESRQRCFANRERFPLSAAAGAEVPSGIRTPVALQGAAAAEALAESPEPLPAGEAHSHAWLVGGFPALLPCVDSKQLGRAFALALWTPAWACRPRPPCKALCAGPGLRAGSLVRQHLRGSSPRWEQELGAWGSGAQGRAGALVGEAETAVG